MKSSCYITLCLLLIPFAAFAGDYEQGVEAFQKKDFAQAITSFTKAIEADPKNPAFFFYRAITYQAKKEYDKAIEDFSKAIPLEPRPAFIYYNRGAMYAKKKEYTKALKDMDEAVRLEPDNAIPYSGRADVHLNNKDYAKAEADSLTALRLDEKTSVGFNNLAWLKATCPDAKFRDGKKALELAKKACELSEWKMPYELSTLAAAYAETGNYPEAIGWQKKALELGQDDMEFIERAKKRLKLYEQNKPYRLEN